MIKFFKNLFDKKVSEVVLPKNGDRIKLIWLPDNGFHTNAYIGWEGIVEDFNPDAKTFCLVRGGSVLVVGSEYKFV